MTFQIKKTSLGYVIKSIFYNFSSVYEKGMSVLSVSDVFDTGLRNYDVYTNVHANGGIVANDAPNVNSHYNQILYVHGRPSDGLTYGGYAALGAVFTGIGFGVVKSIYQAYRAEYQNSLAYLYKRFRKVDKLNSNQLSEKSALIEEDFLHFILANRQAILSKITNNKQRYTFEANAYLATRRKDVMGLPSGKHSNENPVSKFWNNSIANSAPVTAISLAWSWVLAHSFIFWIAWMPVAVFAGAAAVATVPFMAPILAVTFGIGLLVSIYKVVESVKSSRADSALKSNIESIIKDGYVKNNDSDPLLQQDVAAIINYLQSSKSQHAYASYPDTKKVAVVFDLYKEMQADAGAEQTGIAKQLRQRLFMKYEHQKNKQMLSNLNVKPHVSATVVKKPNKDRALSVAALKARMSLGGIDTAAILVGKVAMAMVIGAIIPVFAMWLFSSIAIVFPVLAGAAAIGFNLSILTPIGAGFAAILGFNTFSAFAKERSLYNQSVADSLDAVYKNTSSTKAEKFVELESQLNNLLASIKADPQLVKKLAQKGYDIDCVGADNHYYFEKQKLKPSLWTQFKKGFNRVFTGIAGIGTGTTLPRILLLSGAVFATTLPLMFGAAVLPFVITGLALGVVIATIKVVQYQAERDYAHHKHFAENIDDRLSSMKKRIKELKILTDAPTAKNDDSLLAEVAPVSKGLKSAPSLAVAATLFASPKEGVLPSSLAENTKSEELVPLLDASPY